MTRAGAVARTNRTMPPGRPTIAPARRPPGSAALTPAPAPPAAPGIPTPPAPPARPGTPRPPRLDEIMRDQTRKLGGVLGGKKGAGRGPGSGGNGGGSGGGFQPDMKSAGVGVGLIAGIVFVIWMGTGFF